MGSPRQHVRRGVSLVGAGDVMAGRLAQLTAMFVCLTGASNAQIVAPAGRTLFNLMYVGSQLDGSIQLDGLFGGIQKCYKD